MIPDVTDSRSVQRRGRIVIVAMIALFLLVCVALGVFLWQRQQEENRLAELTRPGLLTVAVPQWGQPIDDVQPLEDNRGLVITYLNRDGEPDPQLRALNLRVGVGMDLCEVLAAAEPSLAENCEATDQQLAASSNGPGTLLWAEGDLRAQTLLVLVGHPADATPEELRVRVDTAELMSVRDLLDLATACADDAIPPITRETATQPRKGSGVE